MLELLDLHRRFSDVVALDGVSFGVPEGRIVGFVGRNGAGKTTAMRIALGVLQADAGHVRWRGLDVDAETRRRFGYMPEERGLYPKMRVLDQLVYLARLHGLEPEDARSQAERAAEDIIEDARAREREIRLGAEDYADEILNTLEVNLSKFIAAVQRGRERLQGKDEPAEVG